jgi:hypothetical protein
MVGSAKYDVVRVLDKVEIRRYPSLITARVCGEDEGFDVLFRFITGKNSQKVRVKMTAPVVSERIEMTTPVMEDASCIAFVMPEKYGLETTPKPLDERVKIAKTSDRFVAALRFSGRWSDSNFSAKTKELLEELTKAKIRTKGGVFTMLYNAPFTPWFMRRNEVAIEVELE